MISQALRSNPIRRALELHTNRHIISIKDFSREQIEEILKLSRSMESRRDRSLEGRVMATLFFEPSTRTRLSFEAAMLQLGGQVLGFADGNVSSAKKGETLSDTIRMVTSYADVIVIRHPLEGAARLASEVASVPVINAGDGANQHPTQTFLDLYTIWRWHPDILNDSEPLTIAFLGDLRYGRTVHSLIIALSLFKVSFKFISPPSLRLPDTYLSYLREKGIPYVEGESLQDAVRDVDILYATRIQEERFPDPIEFMRVRSVYRLKIDDLEHSRPGFKILHPLPRVGEIDTSVDAHEAAVYFSQASNGVPVRKALLSMLLKAL
ncbi:MAG: aspartate carbamoyltransferase [Planctomycetes bacterium]|nr:aspartate carbamoyltransferase [Planctomycetota bacterium]